MSSQIYKFTNLDDELPLNKTIEISNMIIVVRAVFHENNKYYLQIFLRTKYTTWLIIYYLSDSLAVLRKIRNV